jgi:predicted porin
VTAAYYYDQVKSAALLPTQTPSKLPNFSQVSLLLDYNLSKRTDVYVTAAYSHNGALNYDSIIQTAGIYGYGSSASITGLANGQKQMVGLAAGVRLIF